MFRKVYIFSLIAFATLFVAQSAWAFGTVVVRREAIDAAMRGFEASKEVIQSVAGIMGEDTDGDGTVNGQDDDIDGDGIDNAADPCPFDETDSCPDASAKTDDGADDGFGDDGFGDDGFGEDADLDGIPDAEDNCMDVANEDQADEDEDGVGDACDLDYSQNIPNDPAFDEGGGCNMASTSGPINPAGFILIALGLLQILAVRRRSA